MKIGVIGSLNGDLLTEEIIKLLKSKNFDVDLISINIENTNYYKYQVSTGTLTHVNLKIVRLIEIILEFMLNKKIKYFYPFPNKAFHGLTTRPKYVFDSPNNVKLIDVINKENYEYIIYSSFIYPNLDANTLNIKGSLVFQIVSPSFYFGPSHFFYFFLKKMNNKFSPTLINYSNKEQCLVYNFKTLTKINIPTNFKEGLDTYTILFLDLINLYFTKSNEKLLEVNVKNISAIRKSFTFINFLNLKKYF